ncbi:hypothetical protein [Desulfosediminicola flagellatus]|uniref:hypothetical protein n=1 Tax=Desulfosediminicola flagellatus TaxID=2569541 RepID=UPI0010ACA3CB|nr:hypothetical protein [Desulfosediminicola flagellatus]
MKIRTIKSVLVYFLYPEDTTGPCSAPPEIAQRYIWATTAKTIFWIICSIIVPLIFIVLTR